MSEHGEMVVWTITWDQMPERKVGWMKPMTWLMLLGLLVASCGSVAERAAEKAVENAIEKAAEDGGGGDVDVDLSGGEVNVEGEEGESIQIGENVDIPSGFPIPIPDGGTAISVMSDPANGIASVILQYPGDMWDALVDEYNNYFSGASVQKFEAEGLISWSDPESEQSASLTVDNDAGVQVILTSQS